MPRIVSFVIFGLVLGITTALAGGDEGKRVKLPDEDIIVPIHRLAPLSKLAKASAAMDRFLTANESWVVRYNELTGNPHRAWGSGIPVAGYPSINLVNAPQAAKQFVRDHAGVLNANPDNLRMLYSEIVQGKAYVKYIQQYEGIDVLDSYIDLRISANGKVFMFGSDYHPGITISTTPTLTPATARMLSIVGLDTPPAGENITGGALFVLPLRYPGSIDYRLVYQFIVQENTDEIWDTYVDAHSGQIVWRRNLVMRFHEGGKKGNGTTAAISGRVTIEIYRDSYLYGPTTVPLRNAYVNVGGKMVITDSDGRYTADIGAATSAPVIAKLSGPWSIARRSDSVTQKNAVISGTAVAGTDFDIHWDNSNSVAPERNGFYHVTLAHDFIRTLDPSDKMSNADRQVPAVVNINQECNANWNGTSVNFFRASARCGNTAEIPDVVHHEYGHAINSFLYQKLIGRGMTSGALSEATADITANMLRDDPRIGLGFMIGGPNEGIIRNSDNVLRYPQNIVNEIHDDGMILTGAVWDMRKTIGLETATRLTHYAKYGTPDGNNAGIAFADYFIEILVADDDDGDLSNGTPHSTSIIPAFLAHGIPASGITITHNPAPDQPIVTDPIAIYGDAVVGVTIDVKKMWISEARVVYSSDNWATQSVAVLNYDQQSRKFSGFIPPHKAGTILRYYIEIQDNYGSVATSPFSIPESSYLVLVGYETKVFYDCEEQDGWTAVSDATTGQWIRDKPIGTWNTSLGNPPSVPYVQPNEDHTPGLGKEKCWVTGNANPQLGLGSNDVDDGSTWLTTRKYDISSYINPVLRYFRWYSNNAGATPGTDEWRVRVTDDGLKWAFLEQTKKSDASWSPRVFILKDLINLATTQMQVEFEASDLDSGSLVEAAVDDFEILDINQAAVSVDPAHTLPTDIRLEQNYPNPFNPTTRISFSTPVSNDVTLSVFSPLGKLIEVIYRGHVPPGTYTLPFDARGLPSGTYTYVLQAGTTRIARNMVLLK